MIKPFIIVCAFNEQENIERFLRAMNVQTYGVFNLFLIDDGSTDATWQIAADFIAQHHLTNFSLIRNNHLGKEKALRSTILSIDDNDALILTTDADCIPAATWVESMVSKYSETAADMIIGPVMIDNAHPFQATEFLSIVAVTLGSAALGHPLMCGGANLGFTKQAYMKALEVMPEKFDNGGDMYLLEAVKKLKLTISSVASKKAIVETIGSDSVKKFFKQRVRWAGKTPRYTDYEIIAAAVTTGLIQIALTVSLIGAFFYPPLLYIWLIKIIFDFIILGITAHKIEKTRLLPYIPPVSIVYPFYVTTTLVIALLRK